MSPGLWKQMMFRRIFSPALKIKTDLACEIEAVEREVGERIDAAVASAKAAPYPDPRDERATEFAA